MRQLIKMFKGLPPEVRMMVAMAGLGTPFGAIYVLKRFLFPTMSMFMVIIIVMGAVAVLCLLGFLISKIFGRGKKKRSKQMANDLAADADGGRVDVGASIKANNEKFFRAIGDMKKTTGSIYDLPWYIVIGDSGCGKTKLINESGLIFSLGRPEGYQLGTLDYNWWFTEDAIFIDMAGRLVNPQDDSDRREWEAFLGTIAKGRKGYPINGALACVSAEHLLQDSPEKIEQDANTTLERLRDLQSKLGVTFATYLIITKCDKLLGFMQFFDRATRDIKFKNEMFGWSRPGDFGELYDPEQFNADFEVLYQRLNDLRLGRLQDESNEIDLGLAYSFPEEFRQMLPPLQTYVRTLFPMIKNPRAIKNLIFRGTYFTSATQEGALILKHLAERLGDEAASQFAPLDDLWPSKRPHFIKDLLVEKVFPEHGLVFRNEKQALRNRKLSKLLRVGSVALCVLLFGTLGLSVYKFSKIMTDPRAHAIANQPQTAYGSSQKVLKAGGTLGADVEVLRAKRFWPFLLSMGTGTNTPIKHLNTIRAGLFEKELLRDELVNISTLLRTEKLEDPRDGKLTIDQAQRYLDAVEQYLVWYAHMDEKSPPAKLTHDSFKALRGVVPRDESSLPVDKSFADQAANYFNIIHGEGDWLNPARLLADEDVRPLETVTAALRTARDYWAHYARLDERHPDENIREWMRIHAQCKTIMDRYNRMLDTAGAERETLEQWKEFAERFNTDYEGLAQAVAGLEWRVGEPAPGRKIPPLHEAIGRQRAAWLDYQSRLSEAYQMEEGDPEESISRAIAALSVGDREVNIIGLDGELWHALQQAELTEWEYDAKYFEKLSEYTSSVDKHFDHVIGFSKGDERTPDQIGASAGVGRVAAKLREINANFQSANFDPSRTSRLPEDWVEKLYELHDLHDQADDAPDDEADARLAVDEPELDSWRADDLATLYEVHRTEIARVEGRTLLRGIAEHLDGLGKWGMAELYPFAQRSDRAKSQYNITIPAGGDDAGARSDRRDQPRQEPKRRAKKKRRRGSEGRRQEEARPRTPSAAMPVEGGGYIPACAERRYLQDLAEVCTELRYVLFDFDQSKYLWSETDPKPLNEVCMERIEAACREYMTTYVREWTEAYRAKKLAEVDLLIGRAAGWEDLTRRLGNSTEVDKVSVELEQSLSEILGVLPFWSYRRNDNDEWYGLSGPGVDEHAQTVGAWMQDAIQKEWPADELGDFAYRADADLSEDQLRGRDRGEAPWSRLASEFAGRWKDLAQVISQTRMPQKFQHKAAKDIKPIGWGRIEGLRGEARLDDEKLTGQFAAFERQAQGLLSVALTARLCKVQSDYFQDSWEPYDGWPYLGGEDARAPKTLEVVEFPKFKEFIREVSRADRDLQPLERNLPEEPLSVARAQFYEECRKWKTFMGLDDQLKTDVLEVSIEGRDPLSKPLGKEVPDDTAQHSYDAAELDLHFRVQEEGADTYTDQAPRLPTKRAEQIGNPRHGLWTWSVAADRRNLTVSLVDSPPDRGFPTIVGRLGEPSPLAFCAYLHRHGVLSKERDRAKWITSHSFDLEQEFKKAGKPKLINKLEPGKRNVGVGFTFTLERDLPAPIKKLEPPPDADAEEAAEAEAAEQE